MIVATEAQLIALLSAYLLPFFRILGIFTSAPILSHRSVPLRVRIAVSMLLAAIVAPLLPAAAAANLSAPGGWLAVAGEALIGFAIGFVARAILAAVEVAGEAIGLQMGLSFAGFFDPDSGQLNAVSRLLNTLSLSAFVAINGPLLMVMATVRSFEIIPPATELGNWLGRMQPTSLGSGLFELGVMIALPFMALLLFVNLGLGVISRIAPQLNIFAIGFPVTIGAGLVLLTLSLPLMQQPFELLAERLLAALAM
ncbi:MAG TPA: flagellar biosynthetic protein FliR [Burkholderiaceae bacterium]|nr:flagellar biosynthetic protein FliR [Burkholderiaceae bacterium]